MHNASSKKLFLHATTLLLAVAITIIHGSASAWAQTQRSRNTIPALVLTLTESGFQPRQVRLPSGLFYLIVNNRSQLKQIDVRLDSPRAERLYQQQVNFRGSKTVPRTNLLNLPAGQYFLTVANHPRWSSRIIVE